MLSGLNEPAHMLALIGLRSRYPLAGEAELQRWLAGLLLGEDLARKVYGDMDDATWSYCCHHTGHTGFW